MHETLFYLRSFHDEKIYTNFGQAKMTVDAWVIGCADTCRSCLQQIPLAQ